jgi:cytochrome c-type biogenesis protein CcmH/NrfG
MANGFWRKEVIDFALDQETEKQVAEQKEWIARDPSNAKPFYHLAQLYRVNHARQEEALALLLEAVRLDENLADAHVALSEIYATKADYPAAWRHARSAESLNNPRAVELLKRHAVPE